MAGDAAGDVADDVACLVTWLVTWQILVKYDVDNSGALDLKEFRTLVDELRRFQGKPGADDEVHRIFTQ